MTYPAGGSATGERRAPKQERLPASAERPAMTGTTTKGWGTRGIRTIVLAAALVCGAGLSFFLGAQVGMNRSDKKQTEALPDPQPVPGSFATASEQEERLLNQAFTLIRQNKGRAALPILGGLRSANPDLSSLSYISALAAMQAGLWQVAAGEYAASLGSGQKISDAYALGAALEAVRPGSLAGAGAGPQTGGDEPLLRRAIAADQANPAPRLELGMRMRHQGDTEGARAMLSSARLRLHPVDPKTVIDTTLLLSDLEKRPVEMLPTNLDPDRGPVELLGAAYVAMRREDYAAVTSLLQKARARLAPDLYNYLIGDPAFAPYRTRSGFGAEF